LIVLLVGACSPHSGDGGSTTQSQAPAPTRSGGRSSKSQTPPPTAISVREYRTTLAEAINPLRSALKRLARARAHKGLNGRVTGVEAAAAHAVEELSPITPPAQFARRHLQLVTALRAFRGELADLSSQVDDLALCTGSAVRAELGDSDATSSLRHTLTTASTKLPDDLPTLKLPPAGQKGGSRPRNGKLIRASSQRGRGELTIDNGGSDDAVVTLAKKDRSPAISVYIRKYDDYTVKGVPDGLYTVFFTGGTAWDRKARAFGRDCAFQRFEDRLKFKTERKGGQVRWKNWTIGLEPSLIGNADTADVDPTDYPR
jgi:hypothetical protein